MSRFLVSAFIARSSFGGDCRCRAISGGVSDGGGEEWGGNVACACGRDGAGGGVDSWVWGYGGHVGALATEVRCEIIRWWCRTCGGWGFHRIRRMDMTRKRRRGMCGRFWWTWGVDHADVGGTTLGRWWRLRMRSGIRKTDRLVVMDAPVPGFRRGMRLCGVEAVAFFVWRAGRGATGGKVGSGFTWIGSGMSLRGSVEDR